MIRIVAESKTDKRIPQEVIMQELALDITRQLISSGAISVNHSELQYKNFTSATLNVIHPRELENRIKIIQDALVSNDIENLKRLVATIGTLLEPRNVADIVSNVGML